MRFQWTMKELEDASDNLILRSLIAERMSTCTNIYSPLHRRLQKIYAKIDTKVQKEQMKKTKGAK